MCQGFLTLLIKGMWEVRALKSQVIGFLTTFLYSKDIFLVNVWLLKACEMFLLAIILIIQF